MIFNFQACQKENLDGAVCQNPPGSSLVLLNVPTKVQLCAVPAPLLSSTALGSGPENISAQENYIRSRF